MNHRSRINALIAALVVTTGLNGIANGSDEMQPVDKLLVDRTEVTIKQFTRYVNATGIKTLAETDGGGFVYASGWEQMPGWTWRTPFGVDADKALPAVHITFDEAAAYCSWAGKRLPTDTEWHHAAYEETRLLTTGEFRQGQTYPYPTGNEPTGANCLNACGPTPAIDYSDKLNRGTGPAPAGSTKRGVNGLYEMGANVWEWTDTGDQTNKGTRGGSWWYGAFQMSNEHRATKPRDMAAVYIGFRCVTER